MIKLDKLNQYVEERGHGSLSQLSTKLGISKQALRSLINGETKNPSIDTVAKIAEILNCSIEELIGKSSKLPHLPSLHSINTNYEKELFFNVVSYIENFISEKFKGENSNLKLGVIIDTIDAVYDYSYRKNPRILDTQFADWYCQTYLIK